MKQNNIKIAVTGGIGSGKSTVCKIIAGKGYPVFSCDEVYAQIAESEKFVREIEKVFGSEYLTAEGRIDRKKLSALVFSDEKELAKLNGITHPMIFSEMFALAESEKGTVFFEVPLLFEGGYQNLFDGVIVVLRDMEARIKSVMERDKLSYEAVKKRILNQFDYDKNDFAQYYVTHNYGNIGDLSANIDRLMSKITIDFNI